MSKEKLCEDVDGNPIYAGDLVVNENGSERVIEFGRHREIFGCGYVYGYYIPDYCKKVNAKDSEQ